MPAAILAFAHDDVYYFFGELGETYDRIYIDTPPALNFYTRSALIACVYRAAEWNHKEIELAAHDLLQLLDRTSGAG